MNEYDTRRLEEAPEIAPYFNDIPQSIATRAYYGTSHFPERAASITKSDYAKSLLIDLNTVKKIVRRAEKRGAELLANPEDVIADWFEEHREGLKARYIAYLNSHSSVMSSMITGPSNFPVARNQKRMNWAQGHYDEIGKFQKKSIKRALRQLLPWGDGSAIQTNDPKALDKIQAKIELLESQREIMKGINKIARKYYKKGVTQIDAEKHAECVEEIVSFSGYEKSTVELALKPDWYGVVPFPSYHLTNTGAEVRRLKDRLKEVANVQAANIDDNFECANVSISDKQQIAIEFDGKPNEEIRGTLKSNGFKWSRYQVAWVRKMTPNAIAVYERIIKPKLQTLSAIN